VGLSEPDALSFTVALRACIVVFPIIWYGVSALLSLSVRRAGGVHNVPAEVVAMGRPRSD